MNSSTFLQKVFGVLVSFVVVAIPATYAYASVSVSVQSLSPSTFVSSGTNVSFTVSATGFNNPTYAVTDSLSGTSVVNGNIDSSGHFSWTPNNNDLGTHNITITVSDTQGNTATTVESIFVSAPATVSIQSLTPASSVTSGVTVQFSAAAYGFSNPTYSISDTFSGSSISNANISSSGAFSWTPVPNQAGVHNITVYVSDSSGHSANVAVSLTVTSAPTVVVQSLSPSANVGTGQSLTFYAAASGFSNPTYSLSDTFNGTTISNSNINSSGYFAWSPSASDLGSHTITVTVVDSAGHVATTTQVVTVLSSASSVQGLSNSTVTNGTTVTFSVPTTGFTNPTFVIQDSFSGSSVTNSSINSAGYFSWTPNLSDVGTHNITVYTNDPYGHTANVTVTIIVNSNTTSTTGGSLALTALSPGTTIAAGSTGTLVAYAYGFTAPVFTISDSFAGTSITNNNITSAGYFTWVPQATDAGSHTITIRAADSYGHSASAQATITVLGSTVSTTNTTTSTNSSDTFVFSTLLTQGMTNNDVTNLQTVLTKLGFFSGPITGYFGPLTTTAVKLYQQSLGLDRLGIVGPATRTALNKLATGSTTSPSANDGYVFENFIGLGYQGNEVTELQKRLTVLGYYTGDITGYYGSLTQAAVIALQKSHGIKQAGYVGPSTRDVLNQ